MKFVRARSALAGVATGGARPLGIFISSIDPATTDIVAAAGFDFVVLDAEHGRLGRIEVENHVRAAEAGGIVPLVRIAENTALQIQSMLDVGAHGVVVPHVNDATGAESAVRASRYAPRGSRGMCPACHGGGWSLDSWRERTGTADAEVVVIPIIESARAVENIHEILAMDGIDTVLFGPGDLSADMGLDFNTERGRMDAAWRRCLDATRAAGKRMLAPTGLGYDEADLLIAPMELMLLRDLAGRVVRDHRGIGGDGHA